MEINYIITGLVILIAIILVILMIRRNRKDGKRFEKGLNESEITPEEHQAGED
jgi:preprotein translocase subunit YajC